MLSSESTKQCRHLGVILYRGPSSDAFFPLLLGPETSPANASRSDSVVVAVYGVFGMNRPFCLWSGKQALLILIFYFPNIWKSYLFQPITIKWKKKTPFYGKVYITSLFIIKDMITREKPPKVAHLWCREQMGTSIFLANTLEIALLVAI